MKLVRGCVSLAPLLGSANAYFFQVSIEGTCFYHKLNLKLFFFKFSIYKITLWYGTSCYLSLFLHNSFRSSSWPLDCHCPANWKDLILNVPSEHKNTQVSLLNGITDLY